MSQSCASVSVILPAYNVEAYIDEALQSIIDQSLAPAQIIVVDDGSSDGTAERVRRFQRDHAIELIVQENRGCGPARNTGVPLASADYLYFFDADDRLEPEFFRRMQDIIERRNKPDLIVFSGKPFVEDGFTPPLVFDYRRGVDLPGTDGVTAMMRLLERGAFYSQVSLYLVKRDHWHTVGLEYPAGFHQDEDVLVPLFSAARSVVVMDDVFFLRRVRPQSTMTMAKDVDHLRARERNTRAALSALANVRPADRQLRKLLRKRCEMFANAYMDIAEQLDARVRLGLLLRVAYRRRHRALSQRVRRHLWRAMGWHFHAR